MSDLPAFRSLSESLSEDRILHWMRVASVADPPGREGSLGARLLMASLCIACLIVGSTAREITHWALGDTVFGPYAAHVARTEAIFRCGGVYGPTDPAIGEPEHRGWSVTDEAPGLPEPSF